MERQPKRKLAEQIPPITKDSPAEYTSGRVRIKRHTLALIKKRYWNGSTAGSVQNFFDQNFGQFGKATVRKDSLGYTVEFDIENKPDEQDTGG